MSTAAAAAPSIVPKKRKASHDSASADHSLSLRKESEGGSSHATEDTTTLAYRTLVDGCSVASSKATSSKAASTGKVPPKKRKASFEIGSFSVSDLPIRKRKLSTDSTSFFRPRLLSAGSIDDAALGLVLPGSGASQTSGEHKLQDVVPHKANVTSSAALEHLDALGDDAASIGLTRENLKDKDDNSQESSLASGNQRLLIEALMMGNNSSTRQRDRFESWGGMSDISLPMGSESIQQSNLPQRETAANTAPIAVSANQNKTDFGQGQSMLSNDSDATSDPDKPVPSKISVSRDRIYSCASIGMASLAEKSELSKMSLNRDRKYSCASVSMASLGEPSTKQSSDGATTDIQAFVAAAMATVGDQLAELAGVVETVAGSTGSVSSEKLKDDIIRDDQSMFSNASSLLEIQAQRERSLSIDVDYDAVAAAVDAAEAATGALGLTTSIAKMAPPSPNRSDKETRSSLPEDFDSSSHLPPIPPIPALSAASSSDRDMEAIRARARAAAGYIPPADLKPGEVPLPQPVKKRPKAPTSKGTTQSFPPDNSYLYNSSNKASSQKWDEMYECLLGFVEDRRRVETKGMSEEEKNSWDWDGNVPTTFKTPDGKALGRWINNQRSAKHKGNLKREREVKLVSTGLKWSVLSTNSWQDMMEELELYVAEKTKDGQEWDGNVPTNYKIKGSTDDENDGEEKNLGRWINRQRSLYQAGKLRKDRELELEKIGLKWSVLSTTSWQAMYETLLEYIKEREQYDGGWDGNVPANYKTNDVPQKALGRWINRQRTAHQKSKLKKEFVDKLNAIGLKWSVHERRSVSLHTMATPVKSNITLGPTPVKSNLSAGTRTTSPAINITTKTAKASAVKHENDTEPDSPKPTDNGVTSTPTTHEKAENSLETKPSAVISSVVNISESGTATSDMLPTSSEGEALSANVFSVRDASPDEVVSAPLASENGNGGNMSHAPPTQTSKIECTT